MQKRNDDKGYERGARGIDGRDGENYHPERYSGKAGQGVVSGDSGAAACGANKSVGALLKSAKGK